MADNLVYCEKEEFCTICATVTIGLEKLCALECEEKLTSYVRAGRGRIYLEISRSDLAKIKELRSVENLFVVAADISDFQCLTADLDTVLERFYHLPKNLSWHSAVEIWKDFNGVCSDILPSDMPDAMKTDQIPRFRVTCTRTNSAPKEKHAFTSMQAAAKFGGGINDQFGWVVDLGNFDLEVLLNIVDNHVVVGISLTKESLFRRNILNFGPTTLRSTLAYCLAVAADIKKGDVVCDPLCGSGAISLETAIEWPCSFNVSGDNFHSAPSRTKDNLEFVNMGRSAKQKAQIVVDTFLWDACHLPLKMNAVDVFITDLPFGKKSGTLVQNWQLYPQVLLEMARVCQAKSGRAVLLTKDKKAMGKALIQSSQFWKKKFLYWINIGGLQAGVYVLQRTSCNFVQK